MAAQYPFQGTIDEVRIWSSALTASQLDDMTPPTLVKSLSGTLGQNDWYTSDVTVTLTGSDTGSGLNRVEYSFDGTIWSIYATPFTISDEGTTALYHRAYDNAGNVFVLPAQDIKIDKTPPVVTINIPVGGDEYVLGETVLADWTATDALSGIDSAIGTVPSGSPINTAWVGPKIFTVTATDYAGNSETVTVSYNVIYNWNGFFPPVENTPALNVVKAGRAIPVKFSLDGYQGLDMDIFVMGYPQSKLIPCPGTGDPDGEMEFAETAGESRLSYDDIEDEYVYVWKTDKEWTGCRQLIVGLIDGTSHVADFQFK